MTFSAQRSAILALPLLFFAPVLSQSQSSSIQPYDPSRRVSSIRLSISDSSYQLPHEFIIEGSETVLLDSLRALAVSHDYLLDYRNGVLSFSSEQLRRIFEDSLSHRLFLHYRILPLTFKREYYFHQIVTRKDSSGKNRVTVSSPSTVFSADEYFGSNLQKSGSIARGFTVGSNRDFALNSGLRMQLSGKLSRDVNLVAALTDENSPIQPEGTTQALRDVDKVFIELKSPQYSATLGDFNTEMQKKQGGEFLRYQRKLRGATGTASFNNLASFSENAQVELTAATSRGKFHTNQFQGIEGNQGPYRLVGKNGEQRLIVVAGSERVYVNGELMTRGEINDYTIDYAGGELVFMSRRLMTSATRVVVDFEYSDRQFTRNFISGSTNLSALSGGLHINAIVVQEADDPASPIDVPLDESSRNILGLSGNDRLKASLSGIRFVGRDSLTQWGLGQYILTDSMINAKQHSILRYAPGDSLALYSASFSYVDQVPRDSAGYIRIGIGHFQFAGIGAGHYLPVQFLPMPQLQRTLDINASTQLSPDISFSGEYAVSQFDRNRLSSLEDQNNNGSAFKFAGRFNRKQLEVWNVNLGALDVSLSERFVDKRFVTPDRFNEVEFDRDWNLESTIAASEEIREASLLYQPTNGISIGGSYGLLERQGQSESKRLRSDVMVSDSVWPTLQYRVEDIRSSHALTNTTSDWVRQKGKLEYSISHVKPGIDVEVEERKSRPTGGDSLLLESFGLLQLSPRISVLELGKMSASAEIQIRSQDSAAHGSLEKAFSSLTQTYMWQLRDWSSFSSNITLNIRSIQFNEEYAKRGNLNSDILLVRSTSRFVPLQRSVDAEVYYEFANQRSARLERAFVRVAKGTGNYLYKGDVNGNGIADEEEFELTRFDGDFVAFYVPSDQLVPVVDLKTSFRLRLQPARVIGGSTGILERVARSLSTETFVRIDEKNSEPDAKQIYLLNFRRFQNDATTIAGSNQFTQDLFLFENSSDLAFRLRYAERSALLQLVSANERSYKKERSMRMRSQLVRELGNQTDYSNSLDRVTSNAFSLRVRDIVADVLSSDFSYRPEPQWEIGFTFGVSRIIDRYEPSRVRADINEQAVRVVYGLFGSGQVRSELRREEVALGNAPADPLRPIPYELTNGKAPGKSYLWQLAFDYRINQNIQITVNYNGRSEGGRPSVHLGRAEARAFF